MCRSFYFLAPATINGDGFWSRVNSHRDSASFKIYIDIYYPCLHKTWSLLGIQHVLHSSGDNHFTFLDEEFLPAVVEDGVGGVVCVHHTVVGLRSRVTLGNCSVDQEQLGEISS